MPYASFRFYQELNDFLPPPQRHRDIVRQFPEGVPVRHAIESFGVPHTEVEIILANGCSVDFAYRLCEGDRISVYPMFEALDVSPLLRVRPRPLRALRFVADAHLGKLAGYLRLLGFDTLFDNDPGDRQLVRIAEREGRVLLSRDRSLLLHRLLTHGCYVREQRPRKQAAYVVERLDLYRQLRPFSRCIRCNSLVQRVDPSQVQQLVPPGVWREFRVFWQCVGCGRVYWRGSHYDKLSAFVASLAGAHGNAH